MSQTKKMSFVESWTNVIVGWTLNFIANMVFLPMFGFDISAKQNLFLGSLYTIVSLCRSYAIRRWFNKKRRG